MVRAGENGRLFEDFKQHSIVAIGWQELGDLTNIKDSDEVRRKVEEKYIDEKPGSRPIFAGEVSRFRFEFKENDNVMTYDPQARAYLVGKIKGPYYYDATRKGLPNVRKVDWKGEVSRDDLSASTRNTLGASTTIFETGADAEKEILGLLTGQGPVITPKQQEEDQLEQYREDIVEKAREFIKDKVQHLDWDEAQQLVAGILRAMGYKTRVSPPGADRGRDVEASPDGLGLSEPRVVSEVKHRQGPMGPEKVRSFITVVKKGSNGLYVSTGGFTKEAKYEAERSDAPLTLIDLDGLVDLIVQYYDDFDAETKVLIPLTKIYWPK